MGRGTLREVGMNRRTLPGVRDVSRDPFGDLGRVGKHFRRSGMGQGTRPKVREGLGDPQGGPEWIGGPSGRSWTGRWTLREV